MGPKAERRIACLRQALRGVRGANFKKGIR
jgi:hypothetical protein